MRSKHLNAIFLGKYATKIESQLVQRNFDLTLAPLKGAVLSPPINGNIPGDLSQKRAELESQWGITEAVAGNRITFSICNGQEWDSPVEVQDYISDEQGGCFRITSRYFLEAAEGHGVRFAAMVNTFAVIPPQESADSILDDDAP